MKNRFLDTCYRLQNIKRFSNRNVVVYHSPAEHSYYCAMMALYIAEYENLRREKKDQFDVALVLKKCLCHDIPETLTGDILFPIKHYNDEIYKMIGNIEEVLVKAELLKHLPNELQTIFFSCILEAKKGKEGELTAFCDLLEVLYYLTEERKMGNRGEWIDEVFATVSEHCENTAKTIIGRKLFDHVTEEFESYNKKEK